MKSSYKKSNKRAKRAPKRYKKKTTKTIRKVVNSVLSRKLETKMNSLDVLSQYGGVTNFNSGITGGDPLNVLPLIGQSTTSDGRIGEAIQPSRLVVKGIIAASLSALFVGTPPNENLRARVMILSHKSYKYMDDVRTLGSINSDLLQVTAAGSRGFTGIASDLLMPINRDVYNVHYDKQFDINPHAPATGTAVGNTQPFSMGKDWFGFTANVPVPKKLSYLTPSSGIPENFAPFCVIGYAYPSGVAPDVLTYKLKGTIESFIYYKDA